jgi:hypothetical protein
MLQYMTQSCQIRKKELKESYSKDLDLVSEGMLPMLAILFRAGGWPGKGGGVVLPS